MRARAVVLAVALVLTPLGAKAADLVVWWEQGSTPRRMRRSGRSLPPSSSIPGSRSSWSNRRRTRCPAKSRPRSRPASRPTSYSAPAPNYGRPNGPTGTTPRPRGRLGPVLDLFDADTIEVCHFCSTARPADAASTRCPWAGIPTTSTSGTASWSGPASPSPMSQRVGAFWTFWCDRVQPAVRKALGRDDIWGVGLPMSAAAADTSDELLQFQLAYGTPCSTATAGLRSTIPPCGRGSSRR